MEDFHTYFLILRLLPWQIAHPAVYYTTSLNTQPALSQEQGILLLATDLLRDARSYTAEMCLARAEGHSPAEQPEPGDAFLTEQVQLVWLSSALRPRGWGSPVVALWLEGGSALPFSE